MLRIFQQKLGMLKSVKKPTLLTEFSSNYVYDKSKPPANPIISTHQTHERAMKEKELLAFEQQKHERERKEHLSEWTNDRENRSLERAALRRRKQMGGEELLANKVLIQDRKDQLRRQLDEEGRNIQRELASMGMRFYTERI